MTRLVVIAGPANSGKMPLGRKLVADDPSLAMVHRDDVRRIIVKPIPEGEMTWLMAAMADHLLFHGHGVVIVAWNLEPADAEIWSTLAQTRRVPMEWLDVRVPSVAAMIPPMETPHGE